MSNAFALDRRVALQVRSDARDALNKRINTWINALPGDGKIWARIQDMSGRQYVAAGGKQNEVTTEITIRHRLGVTASMRVLHGDVAYDIEVVLERDRNWLVLMCKKGVSDG
jgi:SPP1 family predicted phage head-tail adaptor